MNSRLIILLAALPLASFTVLAADETAPAEDEAAATAETAAEAGSETTVTEGDVLIVEEIGSETTERRPMREADFPVPERGANMDSVRAEFGEPQQVHPAVGDPPITRWDYDGYSVFFEYDKVLHAVVTGEE